LNLELLFIEISTLSTATMSVKLKTGADARAMRTVFPPEFKQKVDMQKVKLPLIKVWVQNEVARILGNDDDVVIEMIMGMLEGNKSVSTVHSSHAKQQIGLTLRQPNIKQLQTDVTGFLDKDAAPFCLSLWKLCLSAQEDPNGIPKELLQAKKEELMQERVGGTLTPACLRSTPLT
jgi:serine/arginine repetitive matrix protein 1